MEAQSVHNRIKCVNWLTVLSDALASMECDIVCTHTLGTHKLVVGKIRKSSCNSASPVVNFNASTHKLVPLAA